MYPYCILGTNMRVTVREKKLKNNRISFYLDYYPPIIINGELSRREFLSLYASTKPKTEAEREAGKEARIIAELKRSQRQIELDRDRNALAFSKQKGDFIEFYHSIVNEKIKSTENPRSWIASLGYLEAFTNGKLAFAELTADFVGRYRDYLLNCNSYDINTIKGSYQRKNVKTLSPNSVKIYFTFFVSAIEKAVKKKYLRENPTEEAEPIKSVKVIKEFLTIDELRLLAKTKADIPDNLRRAVLFSCLTGLRFSDIERLKWSNVRENQKEPFLSFRMKKTGEPTNHPISMEARELLGARQDKDAQVFDGLKYSSYVNTLLERWTAKAGLDRRITFHCLRHSFASAQLNGGTATETIQLMLGHKDLATTKKYLHSLGRGKRAAADLISLK